MSGLSSMRAEIASSTVFVSLVCFATIPLLLGTRIPEAEQVPDALQVTSIIFLPLPPSPPPKYNKRNRHRTDPIHAHRPVHRP
ncbi:hypothetical protein CVT25_001712 [Psilocybe cyanescens]|uniref:Uncharacterized protein n=1 Tax=Psilocybe cyanescens TaxID=93625 RepID=A0A409WPF1_PSICY|nr:hypothetical protein CVT25_001712 [Psilocybe cyanescens]